MLDKLPKADVFKVKKLGKSGPWNEEAFRKLVKGSRQRCIATKPNDERSISHMSGSRTQPVRTFATSPIPGQVYELLAELEQKMHEHYYALYMT